MNKKKTFSRRGSIANAKMFFEAFAGVSPMLPDETNKKSKREFRSKYGITFFDFQRFYLKDVCDEYERLPYVDAAETTENLYFEAIENVLNRITKKEKEA